MLSLKALGENLFCVFLLASGAARILGIQVSMLTHHFNLCHHCHMALSVYLPLILKGPQSYWIKSPSYSNTTSS
jgi:hypothetical protein